MIGLLVVLWAEPAPVDLRWSGVCDAPEAVRTRLDAELQTAEDASQWVDVQAKVDVTETEGGVKASVILTTETGETTRALSAANCGELQQAIALLLAIHVDPLGAETREPEPPPEPEPEVEPEPKPEPEASADPAIPPEPEPVVRTVRAPPAPPTPPADRGHAFLRAGVGISAGILPNAAPVFGLAGGWTRRHLRLDARVSYVPPQVDALDGGRVTYQAWDVGARGCGLLLPRFVTIPLCAVVGGGAVHGDASGFEESGRAARGLVYASGSAGVDVPLAARFAFWARVEGGATLLRPQFDIEGLGTVYTARAWRVGARIGAAFDFL